MELSGAAKERSGLKAAAGGAWQKVYSPAKYGGAYNKLSRFIRQKWRKILWITENLTMK